MKRGRWVQTPGWQVNNVNLNVRNLIFEAVWRYEAIDMGF